MKKIGYTMKFLLLFCLSASALANTASKASKTSHPYEFVRPGSFKSDEVGVKSPQNQFSRLKTSNSNGGEKTTIKANGVPPYAVPMEPLVKYSQPDPLYGGDKAKPKATSEEKKSNLVRVKKEDLHVQGLNFSPRIAPKVGTVLPYEDTLLIGNNHQYLGFTGDESFYDNHYPQEPEPIIEIIIKESNQSLPAPPPPPPPKKKKKEQVQVYYVKYKKEPSSHYGGEKIVYDPPVPAVTPPTNNDHHEEEEEEEYHHHHHHEEPVTLSPKPSTTLKAIIKPDSETYHGSGLHITFGKPKHEEDGYDSNTHGSGHYEEQSAPQPSVLLPPKPKSDSQLKKRNPAPFQSPTIPPQQTFFNSPSFSPANNFYRPTAVPAFQQTPRFSVQPQPFTLPGPKTPSSLPPPPQPLASQRPHSALRYTTLPHFQSFSKPQPSFAFPSSRPSHPSPPPPPHPSPSQQPVPQPSVHTQQLYSINQPHLKSTFNINSRSTPSPYHTISNRVTQHGFPKAQSLSPSPSAPTFQQPVRPSSLSISFPKPAPFSQPPNSFPKPTPFSQPSNLFPKAAPFSHQNSFSQTNNLAPQPTFSQPPRTVNSAPRSQNLPASPSALPPLNHFQPRPQQHANNELEQINQRQRQLEHQQRQQQLEQQRQQLLEQQQRQQLLEQQQRQQHLEQLTQQRQQQLEQFNHQQRQKQLDHLNQLQHQKKLEQHQPVEQLNHYQRQQQIEQLNQLHRQQQVDHLNQLQRQKEIEEINQRQRQQHVEQLNQIYRQNLRPQSQSQPQLQPQPQSHSTPQLTQNFHKQVFNSQSKGQSEYEPEIIKSISPDFPFTDQRYEPKPQVPTASPQYISSKTPSQYISTVPPQYVSTAKAITQRYTVPKNIITTTQPSYKSESKVPEIEYITEDPKKAAEEKRKKEEKKKQNVAALPDEVPEDLRQQLLSSDILGNADIQILDYDKIGDIPIDKLPPEALANFQAVAGSDPVPSVVKPDGSDDVVAEASEQVGVAVAPPSSGMEMKVVRYNPDSKEGAQIASQYMQQDATQLEPVVLNDSRYNRYLPLKVSGAQFPVPDVPELRGKNVTSVVVLAPVDYEFLQRHEDVTEETRNGRASHAVLEVQGVHFVAGDVLKTLVKKPTAENYKTWLDKENNTPVDKQSVVLLVIDSKTNATAEPKEIFMYDIGTKKVSKLSGELSAQFVEVAESNSENDDLDEISEGRPSSFTVKETSEVASSSVQSQVRTQRETSVSNESKIKKVSPR